jgi:hypothetical protein
VLPASSLPARNSLVGGGLVGPIFRGRWCVMSTLPLSTRLREWSEQRSGDFGIARLGGVAAINIQRLVYRPSDVVRDANFLLRSPSPRSAAAHPPTGRQISRASPSGPSPVPRPGAPSRLCTHNGILRTHNTASLLSHTSLQFFTLKHLYVTTVL